MDIQHSAIAFMLFSLLMEHVSADQCKAVSGIFGYSLRNRAIRQLSVPDYEQCLSVCKKQHNCHSINFISSHKTCELNWSTRDRDAGNFVPKEGSTYVQMLPGNIPVCELDWKEFQSSCYLFVSDRQNWTEARANCTTRGARLVVISSEEENTFITRHLSVSTWIGLSDEAEEGQFAWEDGSSIVYENFSTGEPNDSGGIEDYVEIRPEGKWNDLSLSNKLPFVCQRS